MNKQIAGIYYYVKMKQKAMIFNFIVEDSFTFNYATAKQFGKYIKF